MQLTPQAVEAYKQILTDPEKHKLEFKPLLECFDESEEATPKDILFEQYIRLVKADVPKVMFYIIMDEIFAAQIGRAQNGDLGYFLKINN